MTDQPHDYRTEAEASLRAGRIAVNPYLCPDYEGISTATGLQAILDCGLDPGASGGAIFLTQIARNTVEEVMVALQLRDETYARRPPLTVNA